MNGPGVCVCCDGNIVPSFEPAFVTSRKLDFTAFFESKPVGGCVVLGEDISMAAAYALDRVLNAVAEVGSISAFKAVPDFPIVIGVGEVLIDNLGLFGADGCDTGRDIAGACWLMMASII